MFKAWDSAGAPSEKPAGWVRNLPDGSVEALAEGSNLEGFLAWCKKGPLVARVDRSEVIPEQNGETLTGFHIRTDWRDPC